MPGLVPGIHVFLFVVKVDVDGRNKSGHDASRQSGMTLRVNPAMTLRVCARPLIRHARPRAGHPRLHDITASRRGWPE